VAAIAAALSSASLASRRWTDARSHGAGVDEPLGDAAVVVRELTLLGLLHLEVLGVHGHDLLAQDFGAAGATA